MQEDTAGITTVGTGNGYATCAECGAVFRRQSIRTEPAGLRDDTHSEYTEICPDCERLDREGERPILGDEDRY